MQGKVSLDAPFIIVRYNLTKAMLAICMCFCSLTIYNIENVPGGRHGLYVAFAVNAAGTPGAIL